MFGGNCDSSKHRARNVLTKESRPDGNRNEMPISFDLESLPVLTFTLRDLGCILLPGMGNGRRVPTSPEFWLHDLISVLNPANLVA